MIILKLYKAPPHVEVGVGDEHWVGYIPCPK